MYKHCAYPISHVSCIWARVRMHAILCPLDFLCTPPTTLANLATGFPMPECWYFDVLLLPDFMKKESSDVSCGTDVRDVLALESYLQTKNDDGIGNLSNRKSDISSLCCPTIELCRISTGIEELIVGGLLANVGIGIVLPTGCPVWLDPVKWK